MTTETQIIIYGASDDLVEVGGAIRGEFDIYEWTAFTLMAPSGERLTVTAEYGDREWEIGVHAASGARMMPTWPIHFGQRPGYEHDPAIFIDAPAGTTITKEA